MKLQMVLRTLHEKYWGLWEHIIEDDLGIQRLADRSRLEDTPEEVNLSQILRNIEN